MLALRSVMLVKPRRAAGYTKYPQRLAGASVNKNARLAASRHAAARESAGGRTTSDIPRARPAAHSRPIAAQWPAVPLAASRWPGSGLSASVWCLVMPSGKSTVFWKRARGASTEAGAVTTTSAAAVRPAATTSLIAGRAPSLAASIAAMTGRAGQAVAFMAQAAPRAMAAASCTRRGWRASVPARLRPSSASTGTSVSRSSAARPAPATRARTPYRARPGAAWPAGTRPRARPRR
jgi:hypothetical protein